jgi:hypothetical protein
MYRNSDGRDSADARLRALLGAWLRVCGETEDAGESACGEVAGVVIAGAAGAMADVVGVVAA